MNQLVRQRAAIYYDLDARLAKRLGGGFNARVALSLGRLLRAATRVYIAAYCDELNPRFKKPHAEQAVGSFLKSVGVRSEVPSA